MLLKTEKIAAFQGQKDFLLRVLQTLQSDLAELDTYLVQKKWKYAKEKAHQLKGISYLLEGHPLLDSLQHIENSDLPLISTSEFRRQLCGQMEQFCTKIKQYIND